MENLRSFTVTHIGWTNHKPSRVKIHDNRNDVYVFASYHETAFDKIQDIAKEYLEKRGIKIDYLSHGKKGFILLSRNFEKPLTK